MPDLEDGDRVTVQGSGSNQYTLARDRAVYSCTCPAWRNMRLPITQRRCKHLIAHLEDISLDDATGRPRVATRVAAAVANVPRIVRPVALPQAQTKYDEADPLRSERAATLANAVDMHLVLADKMEEVYGLRLPRDIAYAAGFYLALQDDEKKELAEYVTTGLAGIGAWFMQNTPLLTQGSDERLRDRAEDDPPELVAVMFGPSDTDERFALVYDEPSEMPSGVIRRRRGTTTLGHATLLETLRDRVIVPVENVLPTDKKVARRETILAWLDEVSRRRDADSAEEEESAIGFQSMGWARHGKSFMDPYVPGWRVPDDLAGTREHNDRQEAYASDEAAVLRMFERANVDLAEGSPGRALFLGREMHMSGLETVRAMASELLIRSYAQLGRNAFVDIVRAHHLTFYPSIDLYELPPPHPIVLLASADDAAGVAQAWMQNTPTEADVEEALKRAASAEVFDAIFDRINDEERDRACRIALGRRLTQLLKLPAASKERSELSALIGRFIDRATIDARAFERVLEARDNALALKAVTSVDLKSSSQGSTPLHIAARAAMPDLVRMLIDRGVDVRTKNARGRMAFDDAMMASRNSARDAHQILLMLEAAGGAVGKVPTLAWGDDSTTASTWATGDKVHHAKFGDGVVERVDGIGDEAKLTIAFELVVVEQQEEALSPAKPKAKSRAKKPPKPTKLMKVLVGKFVERR